MDIKLFRHNEILTI